MPSNRAGFFNLPLELREEIFSYAFLSTSSRQHRQYPTERKSEIKLHLDALARIIKPCTKIFLLSKAIRAAALSWIYAKVTVLIDLSDVEVPRGKLPKWLNAFKENEALFLQNFEVLSSIPILDHGPSGSLPASVPCTIAVSIPLMTAVAVRPFDPVYWSVRDAEKWAADPVFMVYREALLADVDWKLSKVMDGVRTYGASGRLTGNHVKLIADACFLASIESNTISTITYRWIDATRRMSLTGIWDSKARKEEGDNETIRKAFMGTRRL